MRMTEEQYQALLAKRQKPVRQLEAQLERAPKRPKYGNRKVADADGNVHDSGKEYRRWCVLQLRERAGEIQGLRRHAVFDLVVNGVLVCKYIADAAYTEDGQQVAEDTKSEITRKNRAYRIKRKLMQAIHGIHVREV